MRQSMVIAAFSKDVVYIKIYQGFSVRDISFFVCECFDFVANLCIELFAHEML